MYDFSVHFVVSVSYTFDEQICHWHRDSSAITLMIYYVMNTVLCWTSKYEQKTCQTKRKRGKWNTKKHDKSVPYSPQQVWSAAHEFLSAKRKFNFGVTTVRYCLLLHAVLCVWWLAKRFAVFGDLASVGNSTFCPKRNQRKNQQTK